MTTHVKRKYKIIALSLVFTMVFQIVFPTAALALTSADTQPEVWGYQPVDATDNVSLASGAFNYTIPITSIPEYPMAIGYSSGMGMDQEGGTFGFGFNGFSGAISRNVMGLPDDANQAGRTYKYSSQKRWDASLKVTAGAGTNVNGITVGAGVFTKFGFDSYKGAYGAVGTVFGASIKTPGDYGRSAGIGIGGQLVSDSRTPGIGFSLGGGISVGTSNKNHVGTSEGLLGYGISKTLDGKSSKSTNGAYLASVFGKSLFSGPTSGGASSLAPLAYVLPAKTGFGASGTVTFPLGGAGYLSGEGAYSQSKISGEPVNKSGYGFLYLGNYDRSDKNKLADFTIEGENSHSSDFRNAPAYLQRDYFQVNAMGISGTMQLYQNQYGIVSRNYAREQFRTLGILGIKTSRQEVYPWTGVSRTKRNKGVDILALLKKKDNPESKDFDNAMFDEEELLSLNQSQHKFGPAVFKMRGDMAGEFDMASNDVTSLNHFTDHDVNKLRLTQVPGTGTKKSFFFFGQEKSMPLYSPEFAGDDQAAITAAESKVIERSTDISYYTVGDITSKAAADPVSATKKLAEYDPEDPGTYNSSDLANPFNFSQSFYSHYKYVAPSGSKSAMVTLNDNQESINILKDLKTLATSYPNVYSSIGAMEVRTTSGLRYLFGLPAFNKSKTSLQMSGKGIKAPEEDSGNKTDYHSFLENGAKERNKSLTSDGSPYPYAWMLTAIVGDDYIDFDGIPGPSDGDIGYWVKFKYVKAASDYHWRAPFTGLDNIPGAIHDPNDDVYMMSEGYKEIYYLSEIESAAYTCKYTMQKRYDALDAKSTGIWNGSAHNMLTDAKPAANADGDPTGSNFQFLVTKIDLFKKHDGGTNSETRTIGTSGTLIKSTLFKYDYSTSSAVPNNYQVAVNNSVAKSTVPYFLSPDYTGTYIQTGKATLRQVQHIAYNSDNSSVALPAYDFNYWDDDSNPDNANPYSPPYDSDQVDQWGHYFKNSKALGKSGGARDEINYYHHYTELAKADADENARVFNLKQIGLPSGGTMNIDYEAQDYAKAQDQTAFVMRHITAITKSGDKSILTVDITDVGSMGLETAGVLNDGDVVKGEVLFYPETVASADFDESHGVLIVDEATVDAIGSISSSGGRYFQQVTLDNTASSTDAPFITKFRNYMYMESPQARIFKEKISGSCGNIEDLMNKYLTLEKDGPIDAARKIIANVKSVFTSSGFDSGFNGCFGNPEDGDLYPHLSFLRTPVYKGKYTGSRVKSIVLQDDFRYATASNGSGFEARSNEYGTNYFFDRNGDGTGVSAGVATIEPGGGYSSAIDVLKLDGSGFAPSPVIFSSKTTLENDYKADGAGAATNDRISRKKGKTAYEFYTPQDEGLQFQSKFKESDVLNAPTNPNGRFYMFGIFSYLKIKIRVFRKTITIKLPSFIPAIVLWDRQDFYNLKSYAYTDFTDIYGRPKSIVQIDASGKAIGKQQFNYYGLDESVPVYKDGFTSVNTVNRKPGKMDQTWSEAYYTKESDINFIPWILTIRANSKRRFSFTNMKYSYVPPILKEVVSTLDGLETKTTNTGFDYFTGSPIQVESNDSYDNKKIVRTVPAYWEYTQMGPTYNNHTATGAVTNTNNLTATTGTYMYLNTIDNDHLLGAGIVEWKDNNASTGWRIIDYISPSKKYLGTTTYNYEYDKIAGENIRLRYGSQNVLQSAVKNNPAVFRTYKGYTFEVPLNPPGTTDGTGKAKDGTFTSFTGFNYSTSNSAWKLLSTNELYSHNGVLVQSKDVLDKYAAQLLGFNFSNTIGAVSNGSWNASMFDGAENTYHDAVSGKLMLENDKLQLLNAQVVKACQPSFDCGTLAYSNFKVNSGTTYGHLLTVTVPSTPVYNTVIAKINATFNNGINRTYFVSQTDNGEFVVASNVGEAFTGFFTVKLTANTYQLQFNPNDFTDSGFVHDVSVAPPSGYSVSACTQTNSGSGTLSGCPIAVLCTLTNKNYCVPQNDCSGEVHTGSYAFRLNPATNAAGTVGTDFVISPLSPTMTSSEFKRKYKALVWVHNTSPAETELVVEKRNSIGTVLSTASKSMTDAYAVAGNWTLLRIDFDASDASYSTTPSLADYYHVFIRNHSSSGVALYDDFRVLPFNADMTNWVFEHKFNRVVSGLDNDNFASYSDYDARGRVKQSAVEIQNTGKSVVQKFLYNDQKN